MGCCGYFSPLPIRFCTLAWEHNMGVRGDESALTCRSRIFDQLTGLGRLRRTGWRTTSRVTVRGVMGDVRCTMCDLGVMRPARVVYGMAREGGGRREGASVGRGDGRGFCAVRALRAVPTTVGKALGCVRSVVMPALPCPILLCQPLPEDSTVQSRTVAPSCPVLSGPGL